MIRCGGFLVLLGMLAGSAAAGSEAPPYLDVVVGRYQLIGRAPDEGATYAGTAQITRTASGVLLTRRIGERSEKIAGILRRADPGEAWVLSFDWKEGGHKMNMTCLPGTDLDNYGRLSCHWGKAGNPHRLPGMEAYFAQEAWDPIK